MVNLARLLALAMLMLAGSAVAGPAITGISPQACPTSGCILTVTGSGFTGATGVTVGGVAGTGLSVTSDTSITVTAPSAAAGSADVVVTVPVPTQSAITSADQVTYFSPTPLVAHAQNPAIVATSTVGVDLTHLATAAAGQVISIASVGKPGAGIVSTGNPASTTVVYDPRTAYATLAKGTNANDVFPFCLTDTAGQSSCSTVTVLVVGQYVSPVSPPAVVTPPAPASYACTRQWYVTPTAKASGTGTASSPWNSITAADWSGQLQGGDCVNVLAGTYPLTGTAYLSSHGSATAPIVWRSVTPQGAHIQASATMSGALIQTSSPSGMTVTNSKLHGCGSGGFAGIMSDWLTVTANEVYGNAGTNAGQGSGISIWDPGAYPGDATATYRMQVVGNNVHGNTETSAIAGQHTDGNGIIIDDFQNTQSNGARPAYPYRTLVQANTSYGNGGRGIHVFLSDHVDVISNVAYGNCLDPALQPTCGELSSQNSNDVNWASNKAMGNGAKDPAVLNDVWQGAPVATWSGNTTIDAVTGLPSYSFVNSVYPGGTAVNAAAVSAYVKANTLGEKLP